VWRRVLPDEPADVNRDPDKLRAWRARSKPLRSSRRPRERRDETRSETRSTRSEIRARVARRDRVCQVAALVDDAGRCFGGLTPHHRRKASAGGGYTEANLVAVCAHHNDQLEADADLAAAARRVGLVVRRGDPEWDQLG